MLGVRLRVEDIMKFYPDHRPGFIEVVAESIFPTEYGDLIENLVSVGVRIIWRPDPALVVKPDQGHVEKLIASLDAMGVSGITTVFCSGRLQKDTIYDMRKFAGYAEGHGVKFYMEPSGDWDTPSVIEMLSTGPKGPFRLYYSGGFEDINTTAPDWAGYLSEFSGVLFCGGSEDYYQLSAYLRYHRGDVVVPSSGYVSMAAFLEGLGK